MTKRTMDDYFKQLDALNEKIDKLLNWKHALKLGVIRGLGVAIGATIIAAIAFSLITALAREADNIPVIQDLVPRNAIEDTFKQR